uniref:Immunoglobulin domain-containing protein n=1 Tax=Neolamprologus brichardi TaxID=32507 RepID=A0A3Q4H466_NEOBR
MVLIGLLRVLSMLLLFPAELCGLISAQVISVTGTEGQGITVRCHFSFSGNRMFFCKENCNPGNVLIETSEEKAQKGKFSIEYEGTVHSPVLFVTIKPLTKSDAGRYKCGMSRFFGNSEQEVELIVKAGEFYSIIINIYQKWTCTAYFYLLFLLSLLTMCTIFFFLSLITVQTQQESQL